MNMKITNVYESAKDSGRRLSSINPGERRVQKGQKLSCQISLQSGRAFQTVKGFGCAITESAGYVLSFLPKAEQEKIVASCFSQSENSNRYQIARTHINSCDFSLSNWAHVPQEDPSLESFSFEETDRYVTPLLQMAARANKDLGVMASPWSPPAWMKTNNDMNNGGKLKAECRDVWAAYFVRFIKGLAERGLSVKYVTIQNESEAAQTWDSCLWTGTEEAEFAARNLKPALLKSGLDSVKIFVWDHNRDRMLDRLKESLAVPGATEAIDGLAFHWYSGGQYQNEAECARLFPDKELFFTEGSVEGGSRPGKWWPGERYAHNIINDMNSGCSAWIDWNMALDIDGGPNHAGNNCDAAILVDTKSGNVFYQNSYYYIGHFSRFVLPGSKRILCEMNPFMVPAAVDGRMENTMESAAFVRPDGKIALVVMNRTEEDMVFSVGLNESPVDKNAERPYSLKADGAQNEFFCPPRGIQTFIIEG